jgi:hypothetical protein
MAFFAEKQDVKNEKKWRLIETSGISSISESLLLYIENMVIQFFFMCMILSRYIFLMNLK